MPTEVSVPGGTRLAYEDLGDPDAPLAICLHGFPDTPHTWRHLLPALADAGYHAVAPFQRGYAPSSLPGDGAMQPGALVHDVLALYDALGGDDRSVLIGHDWGAIAAYGAASLAPWRWSRIVGLALPPLSISLPTFFEYDQIRRCFYIWFFQSQVADAVVSANNLAFCERLWRDWSPGYDPGAEMPPLRAALCDQKRVAAALGIYRALFDPGQHQETYRAAEAAGTRLPPRPLLYLHGAQDGCIVPTVVTEARRVLSPPSRAELLPDVGHFLHLEAPGDVNARILDFLAGD
jgi:pimeloyl-ACP methyl ester carboxylesterase